MDLSAGGADQLSLALQVALGTLPRAEAAKCWPLINGLLIITLAARHKLPAVYFARAIVAAGGLLSYGPDQIDQFRQAAGYVDRILKMLWGGSGEPISIAALSKLMEPR